jgi:hypothetical protein
MPTTVSAHSASVSGVATRVTAATWSQHSTPSWTTFEVAGNVSNEPATRTNSAAVDHPMPSLNATRAVIDRAPSPRHPS